jgi:hypothetical protein
MKVLVGHALMTLSFFIVYAQSHVVHVWLLLLLCLPLLHKEITFIITGHTALLLCYIHSVWKLGWVASTNQNGDQPQPQLWLMQPWLGWWWLTGLNWLSTSWKTSWVDGWVAVDSTWLSNTIYPHSFICFTLTFTPMLWHTYLWYIIFLHVSCWHIIAT